MLILEENVKQHLVYHTLFTVCLCNNIQDRVCLVFIEYSTVCVFFENLGLIKNFKFI